MKDTDCTGISNLIPLYIDNMLSKKENDIICEHIKVCPKCNEDYAFLKSIMSEARSLPELDVPNGFHETLMRKIEKPRARVNIKRDIFNRRFLTSMAAAAAVIAVSVVSFVNLDKQEFSENPDEFVVETKNETSAPEKEPIEVIVDDASGAEDVKAPSATNPKRVSEKSPTPKIQKAIETPEYTVSQNEEIKTANEGSGEADTASIPSAASLEDENVPTDKTRISEEDVNETSTWSVLNNEDSKLEYHISVSTSEIENAENILSDYETDETGYKIENDVDLVLDKLSELDGYNLISKTESNNEFNYIILER